MSVNGNKKGKCWERELCKKLEELFPTNKFQRVPQSGAFFGGKNRYRAEGAREDAKEILSGDIICPQGFPFSVECKSYKDFPFHKILKGECKELDEWIKQAESDAEVSRKNMIIFMKFNNIGQYVCFDKKLLQDINFHNYMLYINKYVVISYEEFESQYLRINVLREWLDVR